MEKLLKAARTMDRQDPLGRFRGKFHIPPHHDGTELHYFCGHSLGLQPRHAEAVVAGELQAWRELAVRGHFEGSGPWMDYNQRLCQPLARLAGASPAEIVVMNTLTVNLHLLMVSFFQPGGKRCKILLEKNAFPSDRYAVVSQLKFHGLDPQECLVELETEAGSHLLEESTVENYLQAHGEEIALVLWPGVQYISGQAFDLPRIAAAARNAGARVGFDLAHCIGNLPLSLHDSGCDFAAWCHYKYLNSGPGAVAGCFIHQRHLGDSSLPRFNGWWGNNPANRFMMGPDFDPAEDAQAWQASNPPVLSMAPIQASMEIFEEAGMTALRRKSIALTAFLEKGIENYLGELLEIITPRDPARRGCQLSMRMRSGRETGRALFHYLEEHGVLSDWREPDVIRAAPAPLYNSFEDCYKLLQHAADFANATGSPGRRSA